MRNPDLKTHCDDQHCNGSCDCQIGIVRNCHCACGACWLTTNKDIATIMAGAQLAEAAVKNLATGDYSDAEIRAYVHHGADLVQAAVKYDSDKPRFDLLPPNAVVELVKVYSMGAAKYSDRNWEKGMNYGRLFAACMRHLFAFWLGEDKDKESGLHHLAHAAFSCLAIVEYSYTGKGTDDRPR